MKLDKAAVARIKNATPKKQQEGASAIEYLVLAAVVIGIVVLVFGTDTGADIKSWFDTTIMSEFSTE